MRTGSTIGSLLNATFGNAVELILGIIALKEGLIRVVQGNEKKKIDKKVVLLLTLFFFVLCSLHLGIHPVKHPLGMCTSMLLLVLILFLIDSMDVCRFLDFASFLAVPPDRNRRLTISVRNILAFRVKERKKKS